MATPAELDSTTIDTLLERYLALLDEYTTLRSSLNGLQTGIYQNIARANFSAERGIRYGQDHYDDRMQATRRVQVKRGEDDGGNGADSVCFSGHYALNVVVHASGGVKSEGGDEKSEGTKESPVHQDDEHEEEEESPQNESKSSQEKEEESNKPSGKILISKTDPLRWFGLLTPSSLRQAQSQAIQAADDIIPRLATVNMAMAEVELEIRRARKKRTKMEAAAAKEKLKQSQEEQIHRDLERLELSSAAAVDAR